MLAVFQTSLLYALFVLTVFAALRWRRRRRANTEPARYFKPDSWAEFRPVAGDLPQVVDWGTFAARVWDRTRSSVCDNHNVTKLDGGWYVFDDLAHRVGESDLSLADALAQQPADTNPGSDFGVWTPIMEPTQQPAVESATVADFEPAAFIHNGVKHRFDSVADAVAAFKDLRDSPVPSQPEPRFQPGDWATDDALRLANGETVPAASAELHWDDTREGDYVKHFSNETLHDRTLAEPVAHDGHTRYRGKYHQGVRGHAWTPQARVTPANVTA